MRSGDIHRKTKIMLYETLIRGVLMYGCETWVLSQKSENAMRVFERKILRRIFGPVNDNGQWRIRYNHEVYELHKGPDLVTCIKIRRLSWSGHIQRMENTRIPKKALNAKFVGTRTAGRPRGSWEDAVRRDAAGMVQCRNWKRTANDRTTWRQKIEDAKAQCGLWAIGWTAS
jgi:hypothetical protein